MLKILEEANREALATFMWPAGYSAALAQVASAPPELDLDQYSDALSSPTCSSPDQDSYVEVMTLAASPSPDVSLQCDGDSDASQDSSAPPGDSPAAGCRLRPSEGRPGPRRFLTPTPRVSPAAVRRLPRCDAASQRLELGRHLTPTPGSSPVAARRLRQFEDALANSELGRHLTPTPGSSPVAARRLRQLEGALANSELGRHLTPTPGSSPVAARRLRQLEGAVPGGELGRCLTPSPGGRHGSSAGRRLSLRPGVPSGGHRRRSSAQLELLMVFGGAEAADGGGPAAKQEEEGEEEEECYPNCDLSVWMRSCDKEQLEPLQGHISGVIPTWLRGSLLRNGPGRLTVGDDEFKHLFDASALLHRFHISGGNVTYQNRFLRSRSYERNTAARRIVVSEFGTMAAAPDPCQTIFQRVSSMFSTDDLMTDNAMISIYPYGDELYALTETPYLFRIDPDTLETKQRVNLMKHVQVVNHSAHPQLEPDGTVYNLGQRVGLTRPSYCVVRFPPADERGPDSCFERAELVASVPARWSLHPSYMHSFCMTPGYFVLIEQPLAVSTVEVCKTLLQQQPLVAALRWFDEPTRFIVIDRRTNAATDITYQSRPLFFLHTINAYEDEGHLVVDLCSYNDAQMLDCMYVEALKSAQKNPHYAEMFRGRPTRFVLPLAPSSGQAADLVTLRGTTATACRQSDGTVYLTPEVLCDLGTETPRINYDRYSGRKYRYFYAISSDVDGDNPGKLIKVDTATHEALTWCEENVYPSEPIFVQRPDAEEEDDGVLLSALLWARGEDRQVALLVVDARTMKELGRAKFEPEGHVPKCLHGWFKADLG